MENYHKMKDDYNNYLAKGKQHLQAGEFNLALLSFRKAITVTTDHETAYLDIGIILFEEAKYELAKRSFEETLKLNPQNEVAQNYLNQISSLNFSEMRWFGF